MNTYLEQVLSVQFRDIPNSFFIVSFLILCIFIVLVFMLRMNRQKKRMSVFLMLLVEYVFLMFCSTVICRETKYTHHLELMPFWNYHNVLNADRPTDYLEVLLNIMLYSPIGFLLGCLYKRLLPSIMICILLSVVTELSQYVLHRGLCETDDVIHNTLGGLFGWFLYISLCRRLVKLMRLKKGKLTDCIIHLFLR